MRTHLSTVLVILALAAVLGSASGCQPGSDGGSDGEPAPLSPAQVAERASETLAIANPLDRAFQTAALLRRAPPDALPALREAIDAAKLDVGDPEIVAFAMWWSDFSPVEAMGWSSKDWRASTPQVIKAIFEVNAFNQPEIAFQTLAAAPEKFRDAAISGAISGWQRAGGEGLIERVRTIPDIVMRQKVAETLAQQLVLELGAVAALELANSIEERGFREILTLRVASAGSFHGEAEAMAQWAEASITQGDARPSGFARRVGTRWIRVDPERAFEWLESLPAGKDRDDGVMESFRDWMMVDRAAASAWAESTEPATWNEPALGIYLRQLGMKDPKEALTRLTRFEASRARTRTMAKIARRWLSREPGPAAEWLSTSEVVPEALRRRIGPHIEHARAQAASGEADETDDDAALLESEESE